MLRRYVEQILNLYNYIDGLVITDNRGRVEYFQTFRPDVNTLKEKELLGKSILEIYPDLTEDTSSILRVLKTGKPIFNEKQNLINRKGQCIKAVNTTLPIKDGDRIIGAVDVSRYLDAEYERQDITLSTKENASVKDLYSIDDIITGSQSMELIKSRIPLISETDSSVLIYGETGTGKELIAQSIHTSSHRKDKSFISQNCAAIPSNLLESILFGTVKGSYTGAENKPGLFELANGGTLFLDEINSMEISVQAKILKAIEEKKVTRLGGLKSIKINVKIITATNENPIECVKCGRLREDLFYRLSVVQVNLPPLRERQNDIMLLTQYYIDHLNKQMNRNVIGIDEEVENLFMKYDWPGNIRELRNILEGAFNISSGRFISRMHLPEYLTNSIECSENNRDDYVPRSDFDSEGFTLQNAMASYEKSLIIRAIESTQSLTDAASLLGISKQALNYKLGKYELDH